VKCRRMWWLCDLLISTLGLGKWGDDAEVAFSSVSEAPQVSPAKEAPWKARAKCC